jgi:two-component system, NtrC family, sensor kinase
MTTHRRKTPQLKGRKEAAAARRHPPSAADLQKQLDQRSRELVEAQKRLAEALEQQTATAQVLQVISTSPGELEPVFQAMLENAIRICEASFGVLFRYEDGAWRAAAMLGVPPAFAEFWQRGPQRPGPRTALGRVVETRQTIHIVDVTTEPAYVEGEAIFVAAVNLGGFRTILNVPMLKENKLIGVFAIYRQEVLAFTEKQIELVKSFANQAVIAIENTRLLNELRQRMTDLSESLEHQTATAEVLTIISRSPTNVQPVFEAMARSARRLCGAEFSAVYRYEGELIHVVAKLVRSKEQQAAFEQLYPMAPSRGTPVARAILERRTQHVSDTRDDPEYHAALVNTGFRSALAVPMLHEGAPIGAIAVGHSQARKFTEPQVTLLKTFANQAVIAIDNVRLLNELRQRTDDLSESLKQQTAMSEILRVISSSAIDVQPVFETIARSAVDLCGATYGMVFRYDGELITVAAHCNLDEAALDAYQKIWPMRPDNRTVTGQTILERKVVHVPDVEREPKYTFAAAYRTPLGIRTYLGVPMLRDGNPIGAIALYRRQVALFSDREIELVKAFADQAVIAIENTRLLNELRESLQQQTATADVLKVISRSVSKLQPVLNTLVETAAHLCNAEMAFIFRREGEVYRLAANSGFSPEYEAFVKTLSISPGRGTVAARTALEGRVVHIADVITDAEYDVPETFKLGKARTLLGVPLLRENMPIGVIALGRQRVEPFTDNQIELVTTFADQAVIAIENVRLFDEVQARTRELSNP